jgi:hypothetical protein
LEKPGCAFTRSIGDAVAKTCGVSAVPEILEWKITPQDRFIVIASDGVFEFITSQNVVDMVAKYKNPIEAAKNVVAEAYRLWLTYDERTDDITIIIIYLDDIVDASKNSSLLAAASLTSGNEKEDSVHSKVVRNSFSVTGEIKESRPVRKVLSKAKRKEISENFVSDTNETFDFDSIVNTKVYIYVCF